MSKKSNPVMIGGFVVGAVVLLATGVALFGGSELFAKRYNYVAYFEEQTKGVSASATCPRSRCSSTRQSSKR
jgi:paraquat-inducible protein B